MKTKSKVPAPHVLLQRAIRQFKDGKCWTKGALNRKPSKRWPEGAFCSVGMMEHINTDNKTLAVEFLERSLRETTGGISIVGFNDARRTRWKHVKALFQNAVKLAKQAGK